MDELVRIFGGEVGDICPPVMPNTLLFTTRARMFSFLSAQCMVLSMPML